MSKFKGQPEIVWPEFMSLYNFEDDSYCNDIGARAVKRLSRDTLLVLWVSEEDREDRELPASSRFTFYLEHTNCEGEQNTIAVNKCEDERTAERILGTLLAAFQITDDKEGAR